MASEPNVHPDAKAWRDWLESDEGLDAVDPTTIGLPLRMQVYLRNRLWRAFMAGVQHGAVPPSTGDKAERNREGEDEA